MRKEAQQNREHGFTLLEILIAIFLLALVVAMVLGPFTGIIAASREAERKVDLYQTARSLMDILAADIRGIFALPAEGGEVSFKASVESVDLDMPTPRLDFVTTHSLVIGPQQKPFLTIQREVLSQTYMQHPPHCSLLHFDYKN